MIKPGGTRIIHQFQTRLTNNIIPNQNSTLNSDLPDQLRPITYYYSLRWRQIARRKEREDVRRHQPTLSASPTAAAVATSGGTGMVFPNSLIKPSPPPPPPPTLHSAISPGRLTTHRSTSFLRSWQVPRTRSGMIYFSPHPHRIVAAKKGRRRRAAAAGGRRERSVCGNEILSVSGSIDRSAGNGEG